MWDLPAVFTNVSSPFGMSEGDVVLFCPACKHVFLCDKAMVVPSLARLVLYVRDTFIRPPGLVVVVGHLHTHKGTNLSGKFEMCLEQKYVKCLSIFHWKLPFEWENYTLIRASTLQHSETAQMNDWDSWKQTRTLTPRVFLSTASRFFINSPFTSQLPLIYGCTLPFVMHPCISRARVCVCRNVRVSFVFGFSSSCNDAEKEGDQ